MTKHARLCTLCLGLLVALCAAPALAQDKNRKEQGPPPAPVVTAKAATGKVTPMLEIVGTVYFNELAQVAGEVAGRVDSYSMETGQRVARGQVLVRLDAQLLQKDLAAKRAQLEQSRTDLAQASKDYLRMQKLYGSKSISEQEYDKARFLRDALANRVLSLESEVAGLELTIAKTRITAPFDGVVLERMVDRGEWLARGAAVAEIGRSDVFDVLVEVPEESLPYVSRGESVELMVAGRRLAATVAGVIPKGDVATRTFPVRLTVADPGFLAQGMEARATLPAGPDTEMTVVPRDAVISARGQLVVYVNNDGKAAPIPVEVLGYKGDLAGVRAQGLRPGMDVVVKGNERLRPGQALAPADK